MDSDMVKSNGTYGAYNLTQCDGSLLLKHGSGTWKGHFWPGLVFVIWGLWITYNSFQRYFQSRRTAETYTSRSWYRLSVWNGFEPWLKFLGPFAGVWIELFGDHSEYQSLICPNGTFVSDHVHNWQHSSSYIGFILSGFVDVVGSYIELPPGTEQFFNGLAFFSEGFLMVMHGKHEMFDGLVHQLLGWTMLLGALAVWLEYPLRHNILASAFRGFAVILQGVWLCEIGQMMFAGSKAWNPITGGMNPHMMAPVAFVWLSFGIIIFHFLFFLVLKGIDSWRAPAYEVLPLSSRTSKTNDSQRSNFEGDDSANEGSDCLDSPPSGVQESHPHADSPKKHSAHRQQILAALQNLKPSPSGDSKAAGRKRNEHIV
ncbi:hypothetical protein WJX74_003973 [Apatococcus lobatus]|uniref:Transmembrane protein 45B n=2 Tax=Apatococcus TaxID=904362 RepID=A0AAW1RF22_9CHLO